MNSELKLIHTIFEKNVKDQDVFLECKIKEQELKFQRRSPRIKIMIINIIKLLWGGNVFYIGNRLNKSKDFIIESLISIYKNPLKAHMLEKDFEKIENYGIIMSLLINSKLLFNEYFYHNQNRHHHQNFDLCFFLQLFFLVLNYTFYTYNHLI